MTVVKNFLKNTLDGIDWIMIISLIPLFGAGLATMGGFAIYGELTNSAPNDYFLKRQVIWIIAGFAVFFAAHYFDWKFLKRSKFFLIGGYLTVCSLLLLLIILQNEIKGAKSWFDLKYFAFEPSDLAKIVVILILAKYFSSRHREIANIKHILISGIYAAVPALLVLAQPDFGSAAILFLIWLGMIFASGINKKHFFAVVCFSTAFFLISWFFILAPYQKLRITTFINPFLDPKGAGYNVLQSQIAVGSGSVFGKGIGYGSQSRLNFLPEPETDFIFAAFAEEWGFFGVMFIFLFFGIFIWRILKTVFIEKIEKNNFEKLFALGLVFLFFSQFTINVGMNIGVLPVTGLTLPFMSYGGSHIISSFAALGIFSSFSKKT